VPGRTTSPSLHRHLGCRETGLVDLGLAGRRASITGGSHGIGSAIAQALASEGAEIRDSGLRRDTDSLTRSRMRAVQADATDPAELGRAV
jgi:3-oxoacyl-[acyl-carrier protein] reductase